MVTLVFLGSALVAILCSLVVWCCTFGGTCAKDSHENQFFCIMWGIVVAAAVGSSVFTFLVQSVILH